MNYLDVGIFLYFLNGKYSNDQFLLYLLFRQIFSEITKIDLYAHNKLKTDPNKLILTKEVCDEMLYFGCKDLNNSNELMEQIRQKRDVEFERNNFIEYHIFMRIIIETIVKYEKNINPNQMLMKLFFDSNLPDYYDDNKVTV